MRGRRTVEVAEAVGGDRVETDAKDAAHLARLLRLDEVSGLAVRALTMRLPAI